MRKGELGGLLFNAGIPFDLFSTALADLYLFLSINSLNFDFYKM